MGMLVVLDCLVSEDDVVNEKLTKWAIFLMFLKRFYLWERLIKEQLLNKEG